MTPLRVALSVLAVVLLAGCGGVGRRAAPLVRADASRPVAGSAGGLTPFRFFSPSSIWNQPIRSRARLAPNSSALVGALVSEIARGRADGGRPSVTIDTTSYSVPIYTVPPGQPTVAVALRSGSAPALARAWSAVPLPSNALPAVGTDGELVVWQPSSDRLWEFWQLANIGGLWQASWGGAIMNVSSSSGVYGTRAWPGAHPAWGASSCSLSIAGGLITLEDMQLGQINHVLTLSIPSVRANVYASPAERTDGTSSDPLSLPEGARLRIDPRVDLTHLHLPRVALMIAKAAQRYGIVICARGPNIGFYAQDPTPTGANPYVGSAGYFGGRQPSELLAAFPWSDLQVLRMRLHRNRVPTRTSTPIGASPSSTGDGP
jgi:hypothetical protein